jgi:hypothetical protein
MLSNKVVESCEKESKLRFLFFRFLFFVCFFVHSFSVFFLSFNRNVVDFCFSQRNFKQILLDMLSISDSLLPTRNHTSKGRSTPKIRRYPVWFRERVLQTPGNFKQKADHWRVSERTVRRWSNQLRQKSHLKPGRFSPGRPRKLSALHLFLLGFFKLLFPSTYLRLFSVENVFSNSSYWYRCTSLNA